MQKALTESSNVDSIIRMNVEPLNYNARADFNEANVVLNPSQSKIMKMEKLYSQEPKIRYEPSKKTLSNWLFRTKKHVYTAKISQHNSQSPAKYSKLALNGQQLLSSNPHNLPDDEKTSNKNLIEKDSILTNHTSTAVGTGIRPSIRTGSIFHSLPVINNDNNASKQSSTPISSHVKPHLSTTFRDWAPVYPSPSSLFKGAHGACTAHYVGHALSRPPSFNFSSFNYFSPYPPQTKSASNEASKNYSFKTPIHAHDYEHSVTRNKPTTQKENSSKTSTKHGNILSFLWFKMLCSCLVMRSYLDVRRFSNVRSNSGNNSSTLRDKKFQLIPTKDGDYEKGKGDDAASIHSKDSANLAGTSDSSDSSLDFVGKPHSTTGRDKNTYDRKDKFFCLIIFALICVLLQFPMFMFKICHFYAEMHHNSSIAASMDRNNASHPLNYYTTRMQSNSSFTNVVFRT